MAQPSDIPEFIHESIRNTHKDIRVIMDGPDGNSYDGVICYGPDEKDVTDTIDFEKAQTERDRLIAEAKSFEYSRTRSDQYLAVEEQLDQLYHDMVAGKGDKTGEWFKAIKKVKDDNPKPS